MTTTNDRIAEAVRLGYQLTVRSQPQADLAEPDWIVVITTPDGRVLFPSAVDDDEGEAQLRALRRVEQDVAERQRGDV